MSNYPKMLYKGDQHNFDSATAQDDTEEQVLRDNGWVDYINLPEREMGVARGSIGAGALGGSSEFSKDAFVPVEQFDALGEENTKLKEELVEALEEKGDLLKQFESFRNDVVAMKDRIAELQGDTTPVGATNKNEERIAELEKLTVPQLKELAASKGIQFKSNASEKALIELIISSDGAAEVGK